jgi:hypothetical protein
VKTPKTLAELRVAVRKEQEYHRYHASKNPDNNAAKIAAKILRWVDRSLFRLGVKFSRGRPVERRGRGIR